mmetsp:Transcript_2027/g.2713  ORF Transcript_2027/g.2713 Transcript_2027/m.2713 type:complete len:201 (+) Transcript_2027:459-1061(+)
MFIHIFNPHLSKITPKQYIMITYPVVRKLMNKCVHNLFVWKKPFQIIRAQFQVYPLTHVRIIPKQTTAMRLHIILNPIINRIHLPKSTHYKLPRHHNRFHPRIRRQLMQYLQRTKRMRSLIRTSMTKTLPRTRLKLTKFIILILHGHITPTFPPARNRHRIPTITPTTTSNTFLHPGIFLRKTSYRRIRSSRLHIFHGGR